MPSARCAPQFVGYLCQIQTPQRATAPESGAKMAEINFRSQASQIPRNFITTDFISSLSQTVS